MDTKMSGTGSTSTEDKFPRYLSITGKPLPQLETARLVLGHCRDVAEYDKLNRLGEGAYGVVHRSRDRTNGKIVALKQINIIEEDRGNGIPITALREISILKSLRHLNVINVVDVAVGRDGPGLNNIYMVLEYAEQDLASLLDHARVKFSESEVKCLMKQLFEGLDYLHRRDIIHRDIKMSNILLTSNGVLKLADFGLAREFAPRPLTPGVVTVWYRAPEVLLMETRYNSAIDIWSAGCIMGELILCAPLLPGNTELEQWSLITALIGAPSDRLWPRMRQLPGLVGPGRLPILPPQGSSKHPKGKLEHTLDGSKRECIGFMRDLLNYNPEDRPRAGRALRHPYFTREQPMPCQPEMIQTFPEIRNAPEMEKRSEYHSDVGRKAPPQDGRRGGGQNIGKRGGRGVGDGAIQRWGPQQEGGRGRGQPFPPLPPSRGGPQLQQDVTSGVGSSVGYVFDFEDELAARKRRKK